MKFYHALSLCFLVILCRFEVFCIDVCVGAVGIVARPGDGCYFTLLLLPFSFVTHFFAISIRQRVRSKALYATA